MNGPSSSNGEWMMRENLMKKDPRFDSIWSIFIIFKLVIWDRANRGIKENKWFKGTG